MNQVLQNTRTISVRIQDIINDVHGKISIESSPQDVRERKRHVLRSVESLVTDDSSTVFACQESRETVVNTLYGLLATFELPGQKPNPPATTSTQLVVIQSALIMQIVGFLTDLKLQQKH